MYYNICGDGPMQNIIQIKNLSFAYDKKIIFDKFNLEIKKGIFTTMIGPSESGKSTLIKMIEGTIKTDSTYVKGKVFTLYYTENGKKIVINELLTHLKKVKKQQIIEVCQKMNIESLLDKKIKDLTIDQKQMIPLIEAIILKPAIIIFNSTQGQVNNFYKMKILNELKKIESTIIHVTNDIEDIFFGDEVVVINNGKLIIQDKVISILKNTDVFEKNKLEKPFILELSERLNFYNLINKTYYKKDELVNAIWK